MVKFLFVLIDSQAAAILIQAEEQHQYGGNINTMREPGRRERQITRKNKKREKREKGRKKNLKTARKERRCDRNS